MSNENALAELDYAVNNVGQIEQLLGRKLNEYENFLLRLAPHFHWRVFYDSVVITSLRLRLKAELGREPTAEEFTAALDGLRKGWGFNKIVAHVKRMGLGSTYTP